MASLLWPLAAQAGSYSAPTYTGGTITDNVNSWHLDSPFAYYSSSQTYEGSATGNCTTDSQGNPTSATLSASGQTPPLTAKFTWQPAFSGEPAPTSVIVIQQCTVSVYSQSHSLQATISGSCSDGLDGSQSGCPSSSSSTKYTVETPAGDGSVSVSCSPSAVFTANSGMGSAVGRADASYTANIYPVTLTLTGPIKDSSGNYNILIGQSCSASLSGLPSGTDWTTTYSWSVSGTTFQTWSADTPPVPIMVGTVQIGIIPENTDATYEVDGPGPLTNPTARWYWNDLAKGTGNSTQETVSCTATVTPPAGQGSAFTVSATQPITVWTPVWTATGEGASAVVNNTYIGGSGFWLHAGPGPLDFGATNGMTWTATVSPPPAPVLFGTGSLAIVQIITSYDCGFVTNTTPSASLPYSDNGQTGLDGSWPYPWETATSNYTGGMNYISGDSPGVPVAPDQSAHDNISFEDHLMYCPPGSVQYVPVAKYIWSADMSATLPATGNWINFTGSAGTVTDAQRTGNFLPSNEFPSWIQIVP